MYKVHAKAYDIRHYYEDMKEVTIFKLPCNIPEIWIPLSFTSLEKPELVPSKFRSQRIEYQAVPNIQCNDTALT